MFGCVVVFSEIIAPYNDTLSSWSETDVGADIAEYYDGNVSATLSVSTTVLSGQPYFGGDGDAVLQFSAYTVLNQIYTVSSQHFVAPDPVYCDDPADLAGCWNPYTFSVTGGNGSYYVVGYTENEEGGDSEGYIEIADTSWSVSSAPPQITSVVNSNTSVAAEATLNSAGYWTIWGNSLITNPGDPPSTVAASGTGVNVTTNCGYCVVSAGPINVYYAIGGASSTQTGMHDLQVTTYAGFQSTLSSADQVKIGDPTPVIQSISPGTWNARCHLQSAGRGSEPARW